jgi:hypothetical protein
MIIENPVGKNKQKTLTIKVMCQVTAPERTKFTAAEQNSGETTNKNKGQVNAVKVIDPNMADPLRAQEFSVGF